MSEKNIREAEFFDARYEAPASPSLNGFYDKARSKRLYYERVSALASPGTTVLEYGCGLGGAAYALAAQGAHVTGIDISATAIETAKRKAAEEGVVAEFRIADAENLPFEDDSFDLICGTGIIHHLDLEKAIPEIARTLKSGGSAIFYEPLGHNPVLQLYRRLTPQSHTPDEHPLLKKDLESFEQYFDTVQADFYDLFSLIAIPFLKMPGGSRLFRLLETVDRSLLKAIAPLRWQAAILLLKLSKRSDLPAPTSH